MSTVIAECEHFILCRQNQTRRGLPHKKRVFSITTKYRSRYNFVNPEGDPNGKLLEVVRDEIDPTHVLGKIEGFSWQFLKKHRLTKFGHG